MPRRTCARIAGQFDLRCDAADDAGFSAALASLLADTIAADRAVDPARPQPTGAENAALSPVKDIALFPEGIFMALQQAPPSARLDMICTMPIHIQFKYNDAFSAACAVFSRQARRCAWYSSWTWRTSPRARTASAARSAT